MALRQLILSKNIERQRAALTANEQARDALAQRRAAMSTREAEIEAALNEMTPETSEEDRQLAEGEAEQFERDAQALTEEEETNASERSTIEAEIARLQAELDELNERAKTQAPAPAENAPRTERKDEKTMNTRTSFFNMTIQERDAFMARDDVKGFLQRVRAVRAEQRSVTGADLAIPTVILGLIRENIENYSKLKKHVTVRNVRGKGRVLVSGPIPEAVWTEMCATLNELDLSFTQVELDGFMVGGIIYVCNALMEDTDIALATEIINALGQAIGLALDKAILYGTGNKMPLGIVTRLAQSADPGTASAGSRPWVNLSSTNIQKIESKTGLELFKAIVKTSGAAKGKYSTGAKFWAMNESTYSTLMGEAMSINAAGALVTGQSMTMPVIGGAIEVLNFMPDNVIVGGYGDGYVLLDRADATFAQSEHYRFPQKQTAFRGDARYDGVPAIPEAFVAFDIAGGTVTSGAVSFAQDKANTTAEG